jgi:ABC-type phosphate transport system auxiliary subunit
MPAPYDSTPSGPPAWLGAVAVGVIVVIGLLVLNAIFGGNGP